MRTVLDRTTSTRVARRAAARPRIAFFSPLPPQKSGISDYSAALLAELTPSYAIDLYHDPAIVPDGGLEAEGMVCRDARLFGRYAAALDYRAIVYQMGNSFYHNFFYETMLRYPGVVTLHDFALVGFHLQHWHRQAPGSERNALVAALHAAHPDRIDQIDAHARRWRRDWDWERAAQECIRLGWFLNGPVLARARGVVVHSPWCVEQTRAHQPGFADRLTVIPQGKRARWVEEADRAAIRVRFELPASALIVASFGFLHPNKMNVETLLAFRALAETDPSALLLFVGEEDDGGLTRREAGRLDLGGRIRFLGRRPAADFADLAAVTDLGVNLRRPPTNGETSAALLDLLAVGVATIVTAVGTFADYPDQAVRKVRWESDGLDGLTAALLELAADRSQRAALGESARAHVRQHHDWSRVGRLYIDAIERAARRDAPAIG